MLQNSTGNVIPEPLVTGNYNTRYNNVTVTSSMLQNSTGNVSAPEGCYTIQFEEMEFLPWDNPDNIVSAEVEDMTRRLKDRVFLPLLLLIGGPANVINMAVFYRQGLRDRVNLCLFALSLADGLFLVQAMFLYGADQLVLPFDTKERFGPVTRFLAHNKLVGLFGFVFVSQILTAIIASERCLCVLMPLRFQTLLQTRTMAVIIAGVYVVVIGLYLFVASRYRVVCVFDPISDTFMYRSGTTDFYQQDKKLFLYFDSFVFGVGIPVVVILVVTTTTIKTAAKIRQAALWRAGTSSASSSSSNNNSTTPPLISPKEIALTKMLIANSVLFIACVLPIALFHIPWLILPEMDIGRRNHNFYFLSEWIKELLSYFNATFNIFVFYAMGSRYRQTFWELFGRKKRDRAMENPSRTRKTNFILILIWYVAGPNFRWCGL